MNIGSIQIVPLTAEGSTERKPTQPARTTTLGQGATLENGNTQDQASLASTPEVVVEMHSDTSMGLPMAVYQFVESKSGLVVLQIPSEQMLNLVQHIRQRLQEMEDKRSGEGK